MLFVGDDAAERSLADVLVREIQPEVSTVRSDLGVLRQGVQGSGHEYLSFCAVLLIVPVPPWLGLVSALLNMHPRRCDQMKTAFPASKFGSMHSRPAK